MNIGGNNQRVRNDLRQKENPTDEEIRRYLTEEVLGECWHELDGNQPGCHCIKCGMRFTAIHYSDWNPKAFNRTFITQADMMDLYKALIKARRWGAFDKFSYDKWLINTNTHYSAWLFCLSGEGYEERCKMVLEFWKGGK